ncbi:mechanosensitive ion channel domain-containing protein [Afipia sp. Root123D2]|uniref:mechanosensitive ion channel family protein n=1 Tax=Afipia sp. Root123D2 TaxID=1736436 RepID=UPI0009E88B99|nr:mechanosensitive ion channel domain-containing protein [Afipia sp. Root123D2]
MIEAIQSGYLRLMAVLTILPNWLIATALVVAGLLLALLAHAIIVQTMRRTLGVRHPRIRALLTNSKGPLRLGLMVLALSFVVRIAPISDNAAATLSGILNVAFIALLGWVALTAVQISSQIYLRQFRLDTEDNLLARKHVTQVRILKRAIDVLIVIMTFGAALMSFEAVRQYGVSLFASAGVAGLAIGLAARPLLSNLIAGIQIAVTQPIRLDDVVIVEGEYGTVEEITTTYVVIKLWDWRRMVVPLSHFIEKPFQNWTRETSALIGSVFLYVDYSVPTEKLREKLMEIVRASPLWDGRVVALQVSDTKDRTVELRALVSAGSAPATWDLRCEVREKLIAYLQQDYPEALPRTRHEAVGVVQPRSGSDQPSLVPTDQDIRADAGHSQLSEWNRPTSA